MIHVVSQRKREAIMMNKNWAMDYSVGTSSDIYGRFVTKLQHVSIMSEVLALKNKIRWEIYMKKTLRQLGRRRQKTKIVGRKAKRK